MTDLKAALIAAAHRAGEEHRGLIFWDDVFADPEVARLLDVRSALLALRAEVEGRLPDVDYQIETVDGRLRPMRTPADGWECCQSAILDLIDRAMKGER